MTPRELRLTELLAECRTRAEAAEDKLGEALDRQDAMAAQIEALRERALPVEGSIDVRARQ